MFYRRADKEYKYEEYYDIVFTWDEVSNFEISGCIFQLKYSFSGIV